MLRNYRNVSTTHSKLNYFIIEFFNRIESETGPFDDSFFGADFLKIVKRHPGILKQPCRLICSEIRGWTQAKRTKLCDEIRQSNDIIKICKGGYSPQVIKAPSKKLKKKHTPKIGAYSYLDILGVARELFTNLYAQVLDGKAFREVYATSLREHFEVFREANEDITICPICGISELKTKYDKFRDQYDHYLPKALYPFSAVNFDNLVPTCMECNGLQAKADKDVINGYTGKLFFPYDIDHKGIAIKIKICKDDLDLDKISWDLSYTNTDAKDDEIRSWRGIYKIDERYMGFIRGRIKKWYRWNWEYIKDKSLSTYTLAERQMFCMTALNVDEKLELSFLRKPALEAFLTESPMARAQAEASFYS